MVVTDDQTLEQMRAMPKTERFLGRKGTTFTEAAVTTPTCCPSRASFITGQYAHNHGVLSNKHGYPALAEPGNVLPVWLERAGYTTAHLGKFLNGYEKAIGPITTVAPGWDEWATLLKPRRYLDYELQVNGESVRYGEDKGDYLTSVLTDRAKRLIRDLAPEEDPFYVQLDHYAPHTGAGDPSGDCGKSTGAEGAGVRRYGDKPLPRFGVVQREGRLRQTDLRPAPRPSLGRRQGPDPRRVPLRPRLAGLGRREHEGAGRRARGDRRDRQHRDRLHLGQRVLLRGAPRPRLEDASVRGDHPRAAADPPARVTSGRRARSPGRQQVANIDLAPTILDLAGADPCADSCRVMDGRSLVPLLQGRANFPSDRGVAVEFTQGKDKVKPTLSCSYQGFRTTRGLYVEHTSIPRPSDRKCRDALEVERYDLRADPFELENLGDDSALSARLDALRVCAGIPQPRPRPRVRDVL